MNVAYFSPVKQKLLAQEFWQEFVRKIRKISKFSIVSDVLFLLWFLGSTCHRSGCFPTKDMQTPSLRSDHLYIKHAKCAITIEKSYFRFFRFLVFELLVAKEITIRLQFFVCSKVTKFTGKIGINLTMIF